MRKKLKFSFLLLLLLFSVGCDQTTKSVAKDLLAKSDPVLIFNGFIKFEYAENPGGFLSMGADLPGSQRFLIFIVLTGSVLAISLLLAVKDRSLNLTQLMGLALVTGGGISNLIDRMINDGRVIDFLVIGKGILQTGIFNMADVTLMVGAVLLLAGLIRNKGGGGENHKGTKNRFKNLCAFVVFFSSPYH